MRTIFLNWKNGENDPFSVFNNTLAKYFQRSGKDVEIIEVSNKGWIDQLMTVYAEGIEFVLTWQGIQSNLKMSTGIGFWDYFKIPLICLHGDHPCHMPDNHISDGEYVRHIYTDPLFSVYSNQHFRGKRGAVTLFPPLLHDDQQNDLERGGDFFVMAKNITHPHLMKKYWKEGLDPVIYKLFIELIDLFNTQLMSQPYLDSHSLVDNYLKDQDLEQFFDPEISNVYHYLHNQIDFYARNHKSVELVRALEDFPLKIYGRGWEAVKKSNRHEYYAGLQMKNSQHLYFSSYGIIDISPSVGLHDRTLRALCNGSSFLSSAHIANEFSNFSKFQNLFYGFNGEIVEKCELVMLNPELHNQLSKEFGVEYESRFSHDEFALKIIMIANSMQTNVHSHS
jgi:hypothetical protein